MQITSSDFQHLETMPHETTAYHDNTSPALTFSEIPEGTESLALIMEDPDTPVGLLTHWTVYNMSPGTLQLIPDQEPISGIQGPSDAGDSGYYGPRPPEDTGNHRYMFKLYALDTMIDELPADASADDLRTAIQDHIIEQAEIIGMYSFEDHKDKEK